MDRVTVIAVHFPSTIIYFVNLYNLILLKLRVL